jgi:hypothetical protein
VVSLNIKKEKEKKNVTKGRRLRQKRKKENKRNNSWRNIEGM